MGKEKNNFDYKIRKVDVLSKVKPKYSKTDSISEIRSFIRHDSDKLASEILKLLEK